jgi:thymidylate synthase (FAD)
VIKEDISCEYITHMGDDLNVVNNARVSFDKESKWVADPSAHFSEPEDDKLSLSGADQGLIRFLATGFRKSEWNEMIQGVRSMSDLEIHKLFLKLRRHATHWAPMAHPHVQIRITAPIFLARQYVKHQIGLTWSEISRRYVDDEPAFWFPDGWRARPEGGIKQGSSSVCVNKLEGWKLHLDGDSYRYTRQNIDPGEAAEIYAEGAVGLYLDMIEAGVAPELARINLPQNMMVTWRWTGSLAAFARVCQQRLDNHAQKEAQILGNQISTVMSGLFPVSWDAMVGECLGHLEQP